MKIKRIWTALARAAILGSIGFLVGGLAGCGSMVTYYANKPSNDKGNDTSKFEPESDAFIGEMANKFGVMALFSEVVYRRDDRDRQWCLHPKKHAEATDTAAFGMPHGSDGHWERWISSQDGVHPCMDDHGLYYETYVYKNVPGDIQEAVIAFRGTENRSGQYVPDWGSNLVAAVGFEPKEYRLARENLPPLILALKSAAGDNSKFKIYATGHSLGGGLAQQAGYLSKDIAEVFTFNTSPVTNWSHLRLKGLVKNANPIIHRIYHGGEFLEQARFVSTTFTQARFGRHDIGLQFQGRSEFDGHSMNIIACNFAALIASPKHKAEADHYYPLPFINSTVLASKSDPEVKRNLICPFSDFAGIYTFKTNNGSAGSITVDKLGAVSKCTLSGSKACAGELTLVRDKKEDVVTGAKFGVLITDDLSSDDMAVHLTGSISIDGNLSGTYSGKSGSGAVFTGAVTGIR